jgi:hypothetical protein
MPEMQGVGRPRNALVLSYSPSYGMFLWKAGCSETGLSSLGRGQRRRAAKYLAGALLHVRREARYDIPAASRRN